MSFTGNILSIYSSYGVSTNLECIALLCLFLVLTPIESEPTSNYTTAHPCGYNYKGTVALDHLLLVCHNKNTDNLFLIIVIIYICKGPKCPFSSNCEYIIIKITSGVFGPQEKTMK